MKKKISVLAFLVLLILGGAYWTNRTHKNSLAQKQAAADQDLKDKIGQMLLVGFRGTDAPSDSYIAKTVNGLKPGGVILFDIDVPSGKTFPRNITDPDQTKNLIRELKSYSSTPLLVAVDAEGGLVNRLKEKYGFIPVPSAEEMGKMNDTSKTEMISAELSKELKDLGFNVDFAPVVDVNVNPENPVIGSLGRSFSADPDTVAAQAEAFINGQHDNDILTAIKHFPGHGSSTSDSHLGLTDVTNTYQEKELIPYEKIIGDQKANMIMTAHIVNRNIDPNYPATLSPNFIQKILRERFGFQGVVVSDDMQMGAIVQNFGFSDALIRAVNAGCNLLILSNNGTEYREEMPLEARDIIFNAVKTGQIPIEKIDDSYAKIMKMKEKMD